MEFPLMLKKKLDENLSFSDWKVQVTVHWETEWSLWFNFFFKKRRVCTFKKN